MSGTLRPQSHVRSAAAGSAETPKVRKRAQHLTQTACRNNRTADADPVAIDGTFEAWGSAVKTTSRTSRRAPVAIGAAAESNWISITAAAKRAGVSRKTLRRWIRDGLLYATRLPSPTGMGHLRVWRGLRA